jgi:hypothetical protein
MSSHRKLWARHGVLALACLLGCTTRHRVGEPDAAAPRDAAMPAMDAAADRDAVSDELPDVVAPMILEEDGGELSEPMSCEQQIDEALDGLPDDLACIGLYSDVASKTIAPGVRAFAPAVPLWSDGSGKQRWVYLPPGEKIDATLPNDWVFPQGTKFFKEFRVHGRRIETRIYYKLTDRRWVRATYEWNREETVAKRSFGSDREDVLISGTQYHVPSGRECDQCHGGRRDRVLGFEAISLGLAGAQGITLQDLVDEDLLSPAPIRTKLSIGDDGTGLAQPVLSFLHINCGVSCHNDNQNSEAYSSDLRMRLHPQELDGRPATSLEPILNLVGVQAKSKRWGTMNRVTPGSPRDSLVYQLMTSRAGPKDQMPPIATRVVPDEQVAQIAEWIRNVQAP